MLPTAKMLLIAGVSPAASATAAPSADLCTSVRDAWLAARTSAESIRNLKFGDSDHCSFSRADLRCTWILPTNRDARRSFRDFGATLTTCLAPQGLRPFPKVEHGVETLSLEVPGPDPNVAIFYPGGHTVTVTIITSE